MSAEPSGGRPPPLAPFGLVLRHDGSWTHDGQPITNTRLRERFDRAVRYLPDEDAYVVQIGRFRGQIEIEEAGFFVRSFDPETGVVALSDGSRELLEVSSLSLSDRDGALLCRVKRALRPEGLPARFHHAAHAELLHAVEADGASLCVAGRVLPLPDLG